MQRNITQPQKGKKVVIHATIGIKRENTLCEVKDIKDHNYWFIFTVYDSIYTKCSEMANPQKQKAY